MAELQFVGTYEGRSKNVGALRYINLFPAVVKNGQTVVAFGTPGLATFVYIGPNAIRGLYTLKGYLYVVAGVALYRVTKAGVVTTISTALLSTTGRVWMTDNGVSLVITDGVYGYTYNLTTLVFAIIADVDFPAAAGACCFMDGRILVHKAATQDFYCSALYDATSWGALDFGTAQADQDNIVTLLATFSNIYVFGLRNTEIWYDAGTAGFPFAVNPSATFNTGCGAAHSVVQTGDTGNSIIWLANTPQGGSFIVRSDGGTPITISTQEMEYWLDQYSTVADAEAFAYRIEGHNFYVITFPTANKTWCYDMTTNTWHELSSGTDGGQHRSRCYAYFDKQHITGDYESGQLYHIDMNMYTDNGTQIIRTLIPPTVGAYDRRTQFERFDLIMETGVGDSGGVDQQVMLSMSDDNGHTWGNEHWATVGKQGAYNTRVYWKRLGSAFFKTFKISISAGVKVVLRYAGITVS
jgi:hypothetical protein